jgi:WhiB family redox-sensing transcriptional regulator
VRRELRLFDRPEWMNAAACTGVNPGVFFDDPSEEGIAKAKAVCASCPVERQCLEYALEHKLTKEWHGVWGGRTHSERRGIIRRRRLAEAG